MRKLFTVLVLCVAIAIGVFYYSRSEKLNANIVKDINIGDIKINDMAIKNSTFYYEKLSENQKKYYRVIARGVMELNKDIALDMIQEVNYDTYKEDIELSLTAFLNDHPEVFYIDDNYEILLIDGVAFKIIKVKLNYTSDTKEEIHNMEQKLKAQLDSMQAKLGSAKNDYEKELLIHDLLATNVTYYTYNDYNDIPILQHTAYGALVDKFAVCDGITKAFQLILSQNGIESIFVTGETENVAHAWCKVKLETDYYNVDLTSDKTLNSENSNLVIHSYLNVTDQEILKTHKIDKNEVLPKCTNTKYNYYIYNDYVIGTIENFEYKLSQIINKQQTKPLLEFNVQGISNVPSKLVQSLYNLNFNNYKTKSITKLEYNKINNNYIVVK